MLAYKCTRLYLTAQGEQKLTTLSCHEVTFPKRLNRQEFFSPSNFVKIRLYAH